MNVLYLVGPVGEWQDLTLRARDVLCRAGLIVVHHVDTVRLQLDGLGVGARLLESSRRDALTCILAALPEGEVAWLVMRIDDLAGPAQRLMCALLDQDVEIVSVPGASTMVGGLVASGLPADRFTVLGSLPASRAGRLALWRRFAHETTTLVCEVHAGELGVVLGEVRAHLGDRQIAVCQAPDAWHGPVGEAEPGEWNGRVTLIVAGADAQPDWTRERVLDEVRALLQTGTSPRDTAREVARRSGWARRQVYELALLVPGDES